MMSCLPFVRAQSVDMAALWTRSDPRRALCGRSMLRTNRPDAQNYNAVGLGCMCLDECSLATHNASASCMTLRKRRPHRASNLAARS